MSGRELAAQLVAERARGLFGACVYCGSPCRGLACRDHRDLLETDPNYYEMRLPARPRERTDAA